MKRFGIIILSILVLYAGMAWALEKCWDREGHADHLASENHHDSDSSIGLSHASEDSSSLIHCAFLANRVGPATNTATGRLPRPIEGASLIPIHSTAPVSIGLSGPVSLRKILAFSFHAGLPHRGEIR